MRGISTEETEKRASAAAPTAKVEALAEWPEKTLERGESDCTFGFDPAGSHHAPARRFADDP
jgi:hypothetical protein